MAVHGCAYDLCGLCDGAVDKVVLLKCPSSSSEILTCRGGLPRSTPTLYGVGGAVVSDISHQIDKWKAEQGGCSGSNTCMFICCAGENDIGSGRSIDKILDDFRAILDELFPPSELNGTSFTIFLGPKFEPWLTHDNASRKQYAKLNNAFQRAIRKHRASGQIRYIDCLTSFCTEETSSAPGAVHGGRAIPDSNYFDVDGLHLSDAGYAVWKTLVENDMSTTESK